MSPPILHLCRHLDPPNNLFTSLSILSKVREELVSLTPNNAMLVGEVRAVLSQERLAEMLQDKTLDARQVQVREGPSNPRRTKKLVGEIPPRRPPPISCFQVLNCPPWFDLTLAGRRDWWASSPQESTLCRLRPERLVLGPGSRCVVPCVTCA